MTKREDRPMNEGTPTSLPTPSELEAQESELKAFFDESAVVPTDEVLMRLLSHAEAQTQAPKRLTQVRSMLALAAVALLAIGLGHWTLPTAVLSVAEASHTTEVAEAAFVDDLAWHDDDLGDGLELLGLPFSSDDPQRAIELVDVLIAELDDV